MKNWPPCKTVFALLVFCLLGAVSLEAGEKKREDRFLPKEKEIIVEFYSGRSSGKGLPPGLAKRGGKLPPGLQKHLERNGTLPPGLQKRIEPLPADLERRLPPIPDGWRRVIVERDVILLDRRTNRILDIIEDVVDLVKGR